MRLKMLKILSGGRGRLILYAGLVLFAASFIYAFARPGHIGKGPIPGREPVSLFRLPGKYGATVSRIDSRTRITTKVLYECGHEEISVREAPPEMIGLTRDELAKECSDWEITSFGPDSVVLFQRRPGMAPQCLRSMFVGVKDGFVTVFYGTPERPCRVKSITRILARRLPAKEVKDLMAGIPVDSEAGLLGILEGLSDLQN
ncbi:MAG: hypothetical protein HPY71_00830 [Firmicutes bacterium]|nr:hypothetical protein [Bacillota bacterium]